MRCWLDTHRPEGTVFLAGCGRSGTTWLADLINYRNGFRMLFEPFFPRKVPELGPAWRAHQYLSPDAPAGAATAVADRVLSGRVANAWTDQFNRRRFASRRLIKDIRANNILGWIRARHPAIPLVYILRHPVPAVLSQLKMSWPSGFDFFLAQPELMADHLEPHRALMTAELDPFEARLVHWCILNYVPLRQFAGGGLHVVFYEDLCRRPREVLPDLFRYIGQEYRPWILETMAVPSRLSRGQSAVVKGADPVESWRAEATPEQMRSTARILAQFGLDRLYGEEPLPRVSADQAGALFRQPPQ